VTFHARPRVAKPGELLFECVRASDRAPMSCELRFHGESFGWETQFFERGELFASRGAFVTRKAVIAWAEEERKAMESGRRWRADNDAHKPRAWRRSAIAHRNGRSLGARWS
jgi:hypothetical protein